MIPLYQFGIAPEIRCSDSKAKTETGAYIFRKVAGVHKLLTSLFLRSDLTNPSSYQGFIIFLPYGTDPSVPVHHTLCVHVL
jgi:hypothetical protein